MLDLLLPTAVLVEPGWWSKFCVRCRAYSPRPRHSTSSRVTEGCRCKRYFADRLQCFCISSDSSHGADQLPG